MKIRSTVLALGIAATLTGCQNMDSNGLLSSGAEAFQAYSLSDAQVKTLSDQACKEMDAKAKIAPANSEYSQRLNKIAAALGDNINGQPVNYKVYETKDVNAFAMANGRYPITGYTNGDQTQPIIDPESGYSETGFSTFTHPIFGDQLANTFMMYQNREPRFYINVLWSGCVWHSGNVNKGVVQLYTGGNSGYAATQQNYPATGYLAGKFIDHTKDTSTAGDSTSTDVWDFIDWPIIRYAEILLNYVEALNEYDPGNPDILTYLNMVRKRAGVPDIEKVYPEAVGNQKQMRELIRRERMVELCYENHRYFDIRTWMIAETEHGDVYGMNIDATNHNANSAFWKRTLSTRDSGLSANGHRKFSPRGYLFPISQEEMDRTNCTQNYGW